MYLVLWKRKRKGQNQTQAYSKTTERKAFLKEMGKQFTPPETAVFSNVTMGQAGRGSGVGVGGWNGAIGLSPFFILMTGLREERVEREKAGKGGEVDRWRREGPWPWLPSMMDGRYLGRKKAFDSGTAKE